MTAELDQLSREELVRRARELGAERPEVMTRVELRDEIVRLSEPDPALRRRSRGWLGVARDLVASVVDAGLNLPGTAAAIRGDARPAEETTGPPPVATLTLAEIYLAQGHIERALGVLDEVLVAEPDHALALELRDRIRQERESGAFRRRAALESEEYVADEPSSPVAAPAPAPFTSVPPPATVRSEPQGFSLPPPDVAAAVASEGSEVVEVPPEVAPVIPPAAPAFDLTTEAEPAVQAAAGPERVADAPFVAESHEVPPFAPELHTGPALEPEPHLHFFPSEPSPHVPSPFEPEYQTEPGMQASVRPAPFETIPPPSTPTLAVPSPRTVAERVLGAACVIVQKGTEVVGHYRVPPNAHGVILRVAWFVPGRRGPTEGSLDVPLDPTEERVPLPPVEASGHVRGALGVELEGAFKPLAVAWVYRVSDGGVSVAFAPPGAPPVALRAQLGREVAELLV
jgi:hypothetical protein